MAKVNIALVGSSGRMGKEIAEIIDGHSNLELNAKVDLHGNSSFKNISEVNAKNIDVVIDFSLPESFEKTIEWCSANAKPLVSGVTGISNKHRELLLELAKSTAVLWAPNMSMGVAFVSELLSKYSVIAEDYDFQIEEFHHSKKVDKPSGTAIHLQECLEKAVAEKKNIPSPLSIRGGGIFGVHSIHAMSDEEVIELKHTALNRSVFAKGAVKSAEWLVQQNSGMYEIKNVLGF